MLLHLRIQDLAIIEAAELEFHRGFSVITGETGAGKSILIMALNLVLGGRGSANDVRSGAEQAKVEALFDISAQPGVMARLEERGLAGDDAQTLVICRSLSRKGRGKVLVNGHLSTVATLAEVVRGLVDISGQHEQQSLLAPENHLRLLDIYAGHDSLLADYETAYRRFRGLEAERQSRLGRARDNLSRLDFLRFQLDEIERLAPEPGEDAALDEERRRLGNAEKLRTGAELAEVLLYGDDGSAFDKLGKAMAELDSLRRVDESLEEVWSGLEGARREIQEAARTLQRYADGCESDPVRLETVENRAAEIAQLCRKHGGDVSEVLAQRDRLAAELEDLTHREERLAALDEEIAVAKAAAMEIAQKLSKARRKASESMAAGVGSELSEMELGGARFVVEFADEGQSLGPCGLDQVGFLWSANAGEELRPLAKIASGGELSRLMLAVKMLVSARDQVGLYIFDEVDTGLGGAAADAIGRKIEAVAKDRQAMAITHLAPIAARAEHHLFVTKEERQESAGARTYSRAAWLERRARQGEIARMIGGQASSKSALSAAREMLRAG